MWSTQSKEKDSTRAIIKDVFTTRATRKERDEMKLTNKVNTFVDICGMEMQT